MPEDSAGLQSRTEKQSFVRALARAFIPIWIVGGYAIIVLPSTGTLSGPPVTDLAWYQQIASYGFLPAMLWSWYRMRKIQNREMAR